MRGACGGLAGPIGRVGRACGGGFGVLKHLELINVITMIHSNVKNRLLTGWPPGNLPC